MTQATINGNTYSDDGTSAKDMLNGGHRTHFLPMVGDVATVAGTVATQAAQTAIDAVNAANGALATKGTSTTSLAVSAGSKSITTQSGKQFTAGNFVTVSRTSAPTTLMHGVVTSYSGTALVVDVASIAGSGTYTDWTIALSGAQGVQGPSGNGVMPYAAKTGAYTVVTTDRGSLIDCTSGTFTLAFQACATLGADWSCYIRNSGTGVITLDPNGAETIDGVATFLLNPGAVVMVQCDGTVLRKSGAGVYDNGYIHVRDQKPNTTQGGTSSTGLNTRVLNTVVANTITGASLASNQVTLPAGVYRFSGAAPVYIGSFGHRLILYNVTGAANLITGRNAFAPSSGSAYAASIDGHFSLSATSVIELRHYVTTGVTTYGLGGASSTGDVEVYADLMIWRVA